jgi:hypothetical protein
MTRQEQKSILIVTRDEVTICIVCNGVDIFMVEHEKSANQIAIHPVIQRVRLLDMQESQSTETPAVKTLDEHRKTKENKVTSQQFFTC